MYANCKAPPEGNVATVRPVVKLAIVSAPAGQTAPVPITEQVTAFVGGQVNPAPTTSVTMALLEAEGPWLVNVTK